MIVVRLFGTPRIEGHGRLVEVDTRKAVALLAYLAVTERAHGREVLTGLLWPDYDEERGRAALRRTLSTLKKGVEGEALVIRRDSVGVDVSCLDLDVTRFRTLVASTEEHGHDPAAPCEHCVRALREAARVATGDFMAGFSLRDAPTFEDWQMYQAEALRRDRMHALERLSRGLAESSDTGAAIEVARSWLDIDPLHEPAHRWLMQLHAWNGDRAAALKQYRVCVAILDAELGVPPLQETSRLYQQVKEGRFTGPRVVARVGRDHVTRTPRRRLPMVGRAAASEALYRAYSTNTTMIGVEGEPGIGKTRLTEEFLGELARRGSRTITSRCYADERSNPFAPVVDALRLAAQTAADRLDSVSPRWLAEAARLVPEIAQGRTLPESAPMRGGAARSVFFEGIWNTLDVMTAGDSRGVWCVEDLQWADEGTLDLIAYRARRPHAASLFVLATWRAGGLDLAQRARLVSASAGEASPLVVNLDRLTPEEVRQLVAAGSNQTVDGDTLYRETEGVPFFVAEYLHALADPGQAATATAYGGDLVRSRIDTVSQKALQVATTASVIGRSFEFDTLRAASGRSEDEVVTALEELLRHGLIAEIEGALPRYDFTHEKIRASVYEQTTLARRRLLHRRVAEVIATGNRTPDKRGAVAAVVGRHLRAAGSDEEAAPWFVLAAEHGRRLHAHTEAVDHLEAALALGHPDVADLHEALGDLHTLLGNYRRAVENYEAAAARAEDEAAARLEHKLGQVSHRSGDFELAATYYRSALELVAEDDLTLKARVHADASLSAHALGSPERGQREAEVALEVAERAADPHALAQSHNILGILATSRGELEGAIDQLTASRAWAEATGDAAAKVAALNNLALAWRARGDQQTAYALWQEALALCRVQGDRHREAALLNHIADLLRSTGRADEAMEHLKQAVAIFAEVGEQGELHPAIWKLVEW